MTDPLIDLNTVAVVIWDALPQTLHVSDCDDAASSVLSYLRSVLTPEALDQERDPDGLYTRDVIVTGTGLHRRIFGDDTQTRDK